MSDYTSTDKEKEQYKIQYSDLSPSLQAIIDGKVDKKDIDSLSKQMDSFMNKMGGMVLTIGTSYPSSPKNNKNIHLNLSNRVLYAYTSSAWKPIAMIPQR